MTAECGENGGLNFREIGVWVNLLEQMMETQMEDVKDLGSGWRVWIAGGGGRGVSGCEVKEGWCFSFYFIYLYYYYFLISKWDQNEI